jgi:flagella basal body P-ring formation protein FlgA
MGSLARVAACLFLAGGSLAVPAIVHASSGRDAAESFAQSWLARQFEQPGSRVEAQALPLDTHLQLHECQGAMTASLPPNLRPRPRMSVLVRCQRTPGWAVRVPVKLQVFRQVLVTSHPMFRGDGLSAGDVRSEPRDITRLGYGYVEKLQQATSRTLTIPLAANSVITPAALGGRRMVKAGDRVQLVARIGGIEVRASGVALGSGDDGARLRVRNSGSGRVVDAMVQAPGVVMALP